MTEAGGGRKETGERTPTHPRRRWGARERGRRTGRILIKVPE